jgi:hypothetical protein
LKEPVKAAAKAVAETASKAVEKVGGFFKGLFGGGGKKVVEGTGKGLRVSNGVTGHYADMNIVRTIEKGEKVQNIINEAKSLTFMTGNEHALVKLSSGERALVSGGSRGIEFKEGQITRLFGHTHPYELTKTGPSKADYDALRTLGQKSSYLLEQGSLSKFYRR